MTGQAVERWSSRLGVILAVAGSAVGLGNFLRFPGQAAQYGGGAFMVAYFLSLLIIGLPICWAEWTMGRYAGQRGYHSATGMFHALLGHPLAKYLGVIGVVIPVVIYMYYVVIEAWCLGYAVLFLLGRMSFEAAGEAGEFFGRFIGVGADGGAMGFGLESAGLYLAVVFLLNFVLIYRGLSKGIEWFCTWAMPALMILAFVVLVRVLTLGAPDPSRPENNVINGLGFMWNPEKVVLEVYEGGRWVMKSELVGEVAVREAEAGLGEGERVRRVGVFEQLSKPQLWLAAAGQIFFSLSVGFGVIVTYSSYLSRRDDVVLSGLSATSANEFCEVGFGGLITLPAAFAFLGISGVVGMSTFALGFNVLPMVFSEMPGGGLFGGMFFFLLFLAAVTSSLSMLQPGIAFLEETLKITRRQSVAILGFVTVVGTGFVFYFSKDLKALDTLDFWVGTFLIFVFATLQIIIFSWVWGVRRGLDEANKGAAIKISGAFEPVMKYICPMFLLAIFGLWVLVNVFGVDLGGGGGELSGYVKDLFVAPNVVAWMAVGLILGFGLFVWLLTARAEAYRKGVER